MANEGFEIEHKAPKGAVAAGAGAASLKKVKDKRLLLEGDTLTTTNGCRHSNPRFCSKNSLHDQCAFVREDGICLVPPRTWKKLFEQLSEEMGNVV